ncbi:hypothetical protein D3C71_1711990 [compost metagenome]
MVVFAIGCQLTPSSVEDSHREIVLPALWPLKLSVLTVASPEHTVVPPVTAPVDRIVTT